MDEGILFRVDERYTSFPTFSVRRDSPQGLLALRLSRRMSKCSTVRHGTTVVDGGDRGATCGD